MEDLLLKLRDYGAVGVKAEFESEGATYDEIAALRALSDFDLTVKIGGPGALNDINMACELGVKNIVAPMIETPYALEKFVDTVKDGNLYINIETITGYNNFEKMRSTEAFSHLKGVVFGRSDMAGSLGEIDVESPQMLEMAQSIACRSGEFILGGAIGVKSIPFIQKLKPCKFETRKIIFDGARVSEKGILLALEFELQWLKSIKKDEKRVSYLSAMLNETHQR